MRPSSLTVLLALTGCEAEELPTTANEQVVYHWNASAGQLCGGTVPTLTRYADMMMEHYGWSPSSRSIEYFWDAELALSVCSASGTAACGRRSAMSTAVFTYDPLDTHELGHTARVGPPRPTHNHISFISEGFATRWESFALETTNVALTSGDFLDPAQLQAALDTKDSAQFAYGDALTWWLALELEYGPAKMAELVAELQGASSADEADRALRRVLGISLAQSAALAEALPAGTIDDPACALEGLPSFTWTGAPLVVERAEPACADEDIVNISERAAIWLFMLEFPSTPTSVEVSVSVPEGEDPLRKSIHLSWCSGEFHPAQLPPTLSATPTPPGTHTGPWKLSGRLVGALRGPLAADGSIAFPRAAFNQAPPP